MAQLYAIVGTVERARFMLEAGVPYLQLRFKAQPLAPYRDEMRGWRARCPETRVIVNDNLDAAVAAGAWGVHLGQEDADRYAPERLKAVVCEQGLALGISTHDDAELARAKSLGAAMVGFGPLFDTRTKQLKHKPHGLGPLVRAVREFGLPVIAIGGIGEETVDAVADTGVAMIAMVAYLDRLQTRGDVEALQRRIAR
jgi:thiamine-phosphate pyrophosphorylase